MIKDIQAYNDSQEAGDRAICQLLRRIVNSVLPEEQSKVWHGHPVWFLDGNPIAGYAKRKNHVTLLFWSGQSFEEEGLEKEGSFKAAEAKYTDVKQIKEEDVRRWLEKSKEIQWDYKNIVKRKGRLERIK